MKSCNAQKYKILANSKKKTAFLKCYEFKDRKIVQIKLSSKTKGPKHSSITKVTRLSLIQKRNRNRKRPQLH